MNSVDHRMFKAMLRSGAMDLKRHCEEVNNLNVFPVPDGDTGANMVATMVGGVNALESSSNEEVSVLAKQMSAGMLLAARGNSGVILSQFFSGFAEGLGTAKEVNVLVFAQAYEKGVKHAYDVVVKPVEGTILTVMREGGEHAFAHINSTTSFEEYFTLLLNKMRESLNNTPELLPVLKEAGVIDSGGAGLLYIIEGMAQAVGGKIIEDVSLDLGSGHERLEVPGNASFNENSTLDYGYCTEFILQLTKAKNGPETFDLNKTIAYLQEIGDSIVAFVDGTLVKVHVHTKTPDAAIAHALQYGEFVRFKMENMTLQHHETMIEKSRRIGMLASSTTQKKAMASLAVVPNKEVGQIFTDYGVDQIMDVGELSNPGTEDFIRKFEATQAEHIILFVNNKNEVMVAELAANMYPDSKVHIIATGDIAEGLSCVSVLDLEDLTLEENLKRCKSELEKCKTIAICRAARNATTFGVEIKEGEAFVLSHGELLCKAVTVEEAFRKWMEKESEEEHSLLMVVYASSVTEEQREAIEACASELNDFMDIQPLEGGDLVYELFAILS